MRFNIRTFAVFIFVYFYAGLGYILRLQDYLFKESNTSFFH